MADDVLKFIAGTQDTSSTLSSPLSLSLPSGEAGIFRTTFNPNLFQVELTEDKTTKVKTSGATTGSGYRDGITDGHTPLSQQITRLFCNGVSITAPSLKYSEPHSAYRNVYVSGVELPYDVTLSWYEGQNLQVWLYHKEWFECYYDRRHDRFVTGPNGKLRTAKITLYDLSWDTLTPVMRIIIYGMQPVTWPNFEAGWNKDSMNGYEVKYKYRLIEIQQADSQGKFPQVAADAPQGRYM